MRQEVATTRTGMKKPRNAKHSGVGGSGWRTTKTPTQRELADLAL